MRTISKINPFGNETREFIEDVKYNNVSDEQFKEILQKKDYKIIALVNNDKSKKYFNELFRNNKYMIFNSKYELENSIYSNTLNNLIDEIITII